MGSSTSKEDLVCKDIASAAIARNRGAMNHRESILEAFAEWDRNGDGTIDKLELVGLIKTLNTDLTDAQVDKLLRAAGTESDSRISYQEMLEWIFKAPHMEHYFRKVKDLQTALEKDLKSQFRRPQDCTPEKWAAVQQQWRKRCDKELQPYVRESFRWHDKNGNEVLEVGESIEFFSNYVKYMIAVKEPVLYLASYFRIVEVQDGINMEAVMELIQVLGPDMLKAFDQDWQTCCEHAFRVLDVNKDRRLTLQEVLEGYLPGHAKHWALLDALKLVVPVDTATKPAEVPNSARDLAKVKEDDVVAQDPVAAGAQTFPAIPAAPAAAASEAAAFPLPAAAEDKEDDVAAAQNPAAATGAEAALAASAFPAAVTPEAAAVPLPPVALAAAPAAAAPAATEAAVVAAPAAAAFAAPKAAAASGVSAAAPAAAAGERQAELI